ncbi:MAG TPA: DNA cytosine methyltransferase [Phycisphaerales bacterium]|nr:DNA cytosine methyltransferase [Phycisphaerales bacterium]
MDLFAGCGGMTWGFRETGKFTPVFAVELDPRAAETYEANFGAHVEQKRIEDVEHFPAADVVIGGPPCQGFSPLNMAGVGLERRSLWREYLDALKESGARAFVMENVPELLRSAEYLDFVKGARNLGFSVEGRILNAADFGVPQTRKRAFVIGSRVGKPEWPDPTHHAPGSLSSGTEEWRTFRWAVEQPTKLPRKPNERNWHRSRNPTPTSLERYRTIPEQGEGRFQLAERRADITPECWLRKKSGSTDVFGRLWWDRPAFTIRTEFYKPEKGRYLHPSEHRPITVREAARCMTFPDKFVFPEKQPMTAVAKQIGNAVPPLLAQRIAEAVADHLAAAEAAETAERPSQPELAGAL